MKTYQKQFNQMTFDHVQEIKKNIPAKRVNIVSEGMYLDVQGQGCWKSEGWYLIY